MNTLDLYSFLINDDECKKYLVGIYARDELPVVFSKMPCCFVANTHERNKPGAHWLAFFIDENKHIEFFDPYGLHPSFYGIDTYLNQVSTTWSYNSKRIQAQLSNSCGQICLFYLYFRARYFSLNDILINFTNDYKNNEKIVLDFLNKSLLIE